VEQLLDISLISGTIPAEHRIPRLASTCPARSRTTAAGKADPSGRSAILSQIPAVLDPPL